MTTIMRIRVDGEEEAEVGDTYRQVVDDDHVIIFRVYRVEEESAFMEAIVDDATVGLLRQGGRYRMERVKK